METFEHPVQSKPLINRASIMWEATKDRRREAAQRMAFPSEAEAGPIQPAGDSRSGALLNVYLIALAVATLILLSRLLDPTPGIDWMALLAFAVLVMLIPLFMLHLSRQQYVAAMGTVVHQLRQANQKLSQQSEAVHQLNDELFLALASTIDLRDPDVVEHSINVARYAVLTAKEMGLSPDKIELLRRAGLMHDIGKLAIPEVILFKPGHLTLEEYHLVQDHVTVGADLLAEFQTLNNISSFVRHHHERYDGQGYPDRLIGEQIPLEARILALADAVEAMASDRPYRKGMDVAEIIAEINEHAGSQFDPAVVASFVRAVKREGSSIIVNSARHEMDRVRNIRANITAPVVATTQESERFHWPRVAMLIAAPCMAVLVAVLLRNAAASLPGDSLYTVKRGQEILKGALLTSLGESAAWHMEQVDRRVQEMMALEVSGRAPHPQLAEDVKAETAEVLAAAAALPAPERERTLALWSIRLHAHSEVAGYTSSVAAALVEPLAMVETSLPVQPEEVVASIATQSSVSLPPPVIATGQAGTLATPLQQVVGTVYVSPVAPVVPTTQPREIPPAREVAIAAAPPLQPLVVGVRTPPPMATPTAVSAYAMVAPLRSPTPKATHLPTATHTSLPTLQPTRRSAASASATPKATSLPTATRTPTSIFPSSSVAAKTPTPTSQVILLPTVTNTPATLPTLATMATRTPLPSPTLKPTYTPLIVETPTAAPTSTPWLTATPVVPPTEVLWPTATPTVEPTSTPWATATPTMEPTATPWPTATPTVEPTATPWPTPTPTLQPTDTPWPTVKPTDTPWPTATPTVQPSNTPLPTDTPTTAPTMASAMKQEPAQTPPPTDTPAPEPTATPMPTNTPAPTETPTPEPTATAVPTETSTPEPTATAVPTNTPVAEPTATPLPTSVPPVGPFSEAGGEEAEATE